MVDVIHIIASDAPDDMLAQTAALVGDGETILSIGPAPRKDLFDREIIPVRAPLNNAHLAGLQLAKFVKNAKLLHAWSPAAADAARWAPGEKNVLLSLAHLRGIHQADISLAGVFDGLWTLTVPTPAQRRVLITLGLDPQRIFVLPPAVEPNRTPATDRKRIRDELGVSDEHFLLAAPGEIIHANGHKQACWAHAMARIVSDRTRILFPGAGPARQAVETFARSTGYKSEIFFTDGLLDSADALTAADAAILLQRHDCGVGALADALAAGLPILASDRPEIADYAPHRRAALLSPAGDMRQAADNLLKLAQDDEIRRKLGQQASKLAAELFDPSTVRDKLNAIRATVVSGRS